MSHREPDVNYDDEQWTHAPDLSQLEFMFELYKNGLLGVKEMRNYVAEKDPAFKSVRDSSIDNAIDERARELQRLREEEDERQRQAAERRQEELAALRER